MMPLVRGHIFSFGIELLSNGIEALTCIIVIILYPHEKKNSLFIEASHFSFPSERAGLGGCDVYRCYVLCYIRANMSV